MVSDVMLKNGARDMITSFISNGVSDVIVSESTMPGGVKFVIVM